MKTERTRCEHVVLMKGAIAGAANLMLGLVVADDTTGLGAGAVVAALIVGAVSYCASIVLWVKGARDLPGGPPHRRSRGVEVTA